MEAAKDIIAKRYAVALFNAAKEADMLKEVTHDLRQLYDEFKVHAKHLNYFLSKTTPLQLKQAVLEKLNKKIECNYVTSNFIKVVLKYNKIYALEHIIEKFFHMFAYYNRELEVTVTSALALNNNELQHLTAELADIFHKNIHLEVKLDKTILGGLLIKIGSQLFDTTLRSKLLEIKKLALQN